MEDRSVLRKKRAKKPRKRNNEYEVCIHVQIRKRTALQLVDSELNTAENEQPVEGLIKLALNNGEH